MKAGDIIEHIMPTGDVVRLEAVKSFAICRGCVFHEGGSMGGAILKDELCPEGGKFGIRCGGDSECDDNFIFKLAKP